ncbi:penicillin-binding transpeptidase domain-containing protein [Ruminococcus sp.]|uniref:penicillin-binding transpeptidase domain-containing protein n=1 Tax=Ruminococcus sp. TaxID=41978 RepID=UPI0025E7E9F6|nr:penicillin-binding transpeptidase domain-containing protein [Ruminococcus sp.]MCR4638133.1 peptidoglycan glycosyltransferase [Ruminococcus sp.]
MKIRKITALAASFAMLAGAASCSSKSVGKIEGADGPAEAAVTTNEATTVPQAATTSAAEKTTEPQSAGAKGNIYDANGNLLVSTAEDGKRRAFADKYAVSFANILTTMSEGYDTAFEDILTKTAPNGSPQAVKLTLDGDVQNEIYSYMENNNIVGAAVVLRTDGSIMAQVSYPSYDPNAVADQKYDENLAWGDVGNKAFSNYEPGSCFKIMSEVIADKHGVYSVHDDGTWDFGNDHPIVNWDHETNKASYPMERSLSSAFINSSNIFFAKAFDNIGEDAVLSDLKTIFHFGADDSDDIKCDFGVLSNNIEIEDVDDLRRSAFGQSKVLTCPIFLSALGREAVFGDMVTPFVLKDIVDNSDPNTKIGEGSRAYDVIASIPPECRDNLLNVMSGVGSDIGVYVAGNYSFYAKTGTAEGWRGDYLYITGCAKNNSDSGAQSYESYDNYGETGSYVVVMEIQNPAEHGFEFASQSAGLYNGIINIVAGK